MSKNHHTTDAAPDRADIKEAVQTRSSGGELPCAVAFDIADKMAVAPREIGNAADLLNIKLTKCQLGLFGYKPGKKIVSPRPDVGEEIMEAIGNAAAEGRLACISAWEIAARFGVSKMTVSGACEALRIKIKPCQLGAF